MSRRDNQTWIESLRGDLGYTLQLHAHEDLANYLYVVAYNYLGNRQVDLAALAAFGPDELAALAQDFVQETLERLARDGFALLQQYSSQGRFTSWAAQIVRRQAAQELRKSYWTRRISAELDPESRSDAIGEFRPGLVLPDTSLAANPELSATQHQIADLLQACMEALPERYRQAFWSCIGEGLGAATVAEVLETTANAIYLLIHRAKQRMKKCLQKAGIGPDVLDLFPN